MDIKQAGQFEDARGRKKHCIFLLQNVTVDEIDGNVIEEGGEFSFFDLEGAAIATPSPYDLVLMSNGALEIAFTNDAELSFMPIGEASPDDQ